MFPTTHNFVKIDTLFFPTDSDYLSSEFNSQGIELLNILMIYSNILEIYHTQINLYYFTLMIFP